MTAGPLRSPDRTPAPASRIGVGVESAQAPAANRWISSRVTPTEMPESTISPQVVSSSGMPSRCRSTRVSASKSPGSKTLPSGAFGGEQVHRLFADHLAEAQIPVDDRDRVALENHGHLTSRPDLAGLHQIKIAADPDHAVRIMAAKIRVDEVPGDTGRLGRLTAGGRENAVDDPFQGRGLNAHGNPSFPAQQLCGVWLRQRATMGYVSAGLSDKERLYHDRGTSHNDHPP